ncbi:MAG: BspA family leucine-rich repeat surface protein, partial [Bacilli bacterium]|nr:BspA family leucine-rich repeat surface protein [Bacilli bacterium]
SYYGLAYQTYFGQGSVGGIENLDTSLVTDMSYMFYMSIIKSESESSSINLNHFDTSNVTNMSHMFDLFYETGVLEIDKWDMSKVTDMSYMFQFCRSIKTTINITNQNIENYEGMFLNAATSEGAEITVNYTTETSDLVDRMIATKSENSNVVKGTLIK